MDTKEELHNKTLGTTSPPPPTGGDQGADGGGGGGEEDQNEPKSPAAPIDPLPLESPTVAEAAGSPTNLQKKVRRAERFGVPVQLSEEEKRNSRAERFGTAPSSQGNSEEQKRKARAERFGTAGNSTADEEAKKKARLARFAPDIKLDSVEEEKRKARAIRFAQTTSSAVSHMNGKSESDRKTLNVDKINEGT